MSYTSRTRNTERRTPRGVWMSPANGSPLNSPLKMSGGSPFHNYSHRSPARRLFGPGWRTLKDAIRDGTFTRWKSGGNLASDYDTGLWSELHRQHPVQMQVSHDKENHVDKLFGQHVGIWFVIGEPFAKGGFGEVRFGYHKSMSAKKFAVKIEPVNHNGMRHLSTEYNIYSILGDSSGIPRCYYYGLCGIMHNALVMDLLGPSLDDVFESMKRKFTLRTVILIALQTFDRLHYLHSRGVVHGDVKGENFLIGLPNEGLDTVIYIVDFGLSQVLKDHTKNVYLYNENSIVCPSGTPRYMSVSAHCGNALSFRDDLESLAYVLVYFLKGRLPWQGIHEKDASKKSAIIKARKTEETPENICSTCPEEFTMFLRYARSLRFQEEPDYEFLRSTFRNLLDRVNAEGDPLNEGGKPHGFDWIGKTFSFRKEPSKHPILPRAEFQKKVSVPSLLPNEKLRLLHQQRSSAMQLTVRSTLNLSAVPDKRGPSGLSKSPQHSFLNPLTHSPSAPHVNEALIQPRNLRVPAPLSARDSAQSARSRPPPVSPRIQKNSVDVSLDDDGGLSLVVEGSSPPPAPEEHPPVPARSLARQRKISIVSPAPIRRRVLLSDGSIGSSKVTHSPLARSTVSATFKYPGASLGESQNRTAETSLTDDSSHSESTSSQKSSQRSSQKSSMDHPELPSLKSPSRQHSAHRLGPAGLSARHTNGVPSTLAINKTALNEHSLQVPNGHGTPRRQQPVSDDSQYGSQLIYPDTVFDSPSHMTISVTTPMGTLRHSQIQPKAVLARPNLRPATDTWTKPLLPNDTPESTARTPTATGPAGMQIMDPKSLHRISVYDVKRDGETMLPGSLMTGGCFTWLKRRARCGGKRPMKTSVSQVLPLGVNGQPKTKLG